MRTSINLIIFIIFSVNIVFAGEILIESFESETFTPENWSTTYDSNTSIIWTRNEGLDLNPVNPAYNQPVSVAQDGNFVAMVNMRDGETNITRLETPFFDIPADEIATLTYWMFHDPLASWGTEGIQIQVDNGDGNWVNVGEFNLRQKDAVFYGWLMASVNLVDYSGQNIRVGFKAMGDFGENIFIDNVNISSANDTTPPACGRIYGDRVAVNSEMKLRVVPRDNQGLLPSLTATYSFDNFTTFYEATFVVTEELAPLNGNRRFNYETTLDAETIAQDGVLRVYLEDFAGNTAIQEYNISWYEPLVSYEDDFEGYNDFIRFFYGYNTWQTFDLDMGNVYPIDEANFTGEGKASAYSIFNPTATTPPLEYNDHQPHDGDKMAVSFTPYNASANDDWLISPAIDPQNNLILDFWARSMTYYGEDHNKMEVLVSTTGLFPENFNPLTYEGNEIITVPFNLAWTNYRFDLSEFADNDHIYIAIHNVTVTGLSLGLCIDDFSVKRESSVVITEPVNNTVFQTGDNILVSASAYDGDDKGVTSVDFLINGFVYSTLTSAPYHYTWYTSGMPAGEYAIKTIMHTTSGTDYEDEINLILNTPPLCSFTSPADGANISANSTVNVIISASDDSKNKSVSTVKLFIDNELKQEFTTDPFEYNWLVEGYDVGDCVLRAETTDNHGTVTTDEVTVNIISISGSVYFEERFNDTKGKGMPIDWMTIDNDGDGTTFEHLDIAFMAHEGEGSVGSYNTAAINDNWLISPQITIRPESMLKFRALSYNSNGESIEDLNILISTTTNEMSEFVNISEIRNIPFTYEDESYVYTDYYISLASYNTQNIYIAWQAITESGNWLLIDYVEISGVNGNDISDDELLIVDSELKQNYPNPFNPITKINYQLATTNFKSASIIVYNAMGQSVWSSNPLTLNSNHCFFDGSKFNSGIYYYSLIIDGRKMDTKSMVLIK